MPFNPPPLGSVEEVAGWTQGAGLESLERGKSLHLPGTQNLISSNAARYLVMLLSELPRPTSGRSVRLAQKSCKSACILAFKKICSSH